MITHTLDHCKYCDARNSIITNFAAGEVVCRNCGVVYEDRIIDETYEGRNFNNENPGSSGRDQNRVGGPSSPEDILGTNITINGKGNFLSRTHRGTGTFNPSKRRTEKRLDELAEKMQLLDSITQKAKELLSKVEKKKKLKGKNLDSVIGSVFFLACRMTGVPRTIDDISKSLRLKDRDVRKCFNSIKRIIIDKEMQPDLNDNIIGLINRYCDNLKGIDLGVNIPEKSLIELKNLANEIGKKINENELLTGRNPKTIAATTILIADQILKLGIGRKTISEYIKTTENTISNAFNELMKNKDFIIPAKYKDRSLN
jgi:transcription initiation factor TFIIB